MTNAEASDTTNHLNKLIKHQDEIHALENQLIQLRNLTTIKQMEISAAQQNIPDISHLKEQREDILAMISIGENSINTLEEFDKNSVSLNAAYTEKTNLAKSITHDNEQAINGINRIIAEAQSKLFDLREGTKSLLADFVFAQANALAEEYVLAAQHLKDAYFKLCALDQFSKNRDLRKINIRGNNSVEFQIPTFNLDACLAHAHPNWPGVLFNQILANNSNWLDKASNDLKNELFALGIEI